MKNGVLPEHKLQAGKESELIVVASGRKNESDRHTEDGTREKNNSGKSASESRGVQGSRVSLALLWKNRRGSIAETPDSSWEREPRNGG